MGNILKFRVKEPAEDEGHIYVPLDKNGLIIQIISRDRSENTPHHLHDGSSWSVNELERLDLLDLLKIHNELSAGIC